MKFVIYADVVETLNVLTKILLDLLTSYIRLRKTIFAYRFRRASLSLSFLPSFLFSFLLISLSFYLFLFILISFLPFFHRLCCKNRESYVAKKTWQNFWFIVPLSFRLRSRTFISTISRNLGIEKVVSLRTITFYAGYTSLRY